MPLLPEELVSRIENAGIIAVLTIDNAESAVPLARVLLENGISAMELTLRTDAAPEALKRIRRDVPDMLAGAGTVLTPDQVRQVLSDGAAFGVSPGFNPRVVQASIDAGLPFAPGISTPTEVEAALELGCRVLKFFHARGMGGPEYLKGMNAPYGFLGLRYIPLGGISIANMADYLTMPEVLAIGGSWIATADLIRKRDWHTIGKNAAEAVEVLKRLRGQG